jgi:hypothetical protein
MPGTPILGEDPLPDDSFLGPEMLYRRYNRSHIEQGLVRPQDFGQFPYSANRQALSDIDHVLHPNCCDGFDATGWGVYGFRVADVTAEIFTVDSDERTFAFFLKHVPLPKCYAHSEVHCKDAASGRESMPPKSVRNKLKIYLTQRISFLIPTQA